MNQKKLKYIVAVLTLCLFCFLFRDLLRQSFGLITGSVSHLYFPEEPVNDIFIFHISDFTMIDYTYEPDDDYFDEVANYIANLKIKSLPNSANTREKTDLRIHIYLRFEKNYTDKVEIDVYNQTLVYINDKPYRILNRGGINTDILFHEENAEYLR